MKKHGMTAFLLCLSMALFIACSGGPAGKATEENNNREYLIAYCFQPSQGGVHQIYTIGEDGSGNQKVIDAPIGLNHHDCSPDGKRYAAVGYMGENFSTWSIHTFHADGTNLTRLTSEEGVWDSEPAWSPDGARIVFTRTYPAENHREEIWLMEADGSGQHFIGISGFAPKWSPDGMRFIYASKRESGFDLYTCAVDGSDEQRLTESDTAEFFPMYSPDGSRIVFCASSGDINSPENARTFEIYTMNADGSGLRKLTENDSMDSNPRWSPDGSRLLFCSDRHEKEKWEVYVMNADGTDVLRLTHSPEGVTAINPTWILK